MIVYVHVKNSESMNNCLILSLESLNNKMSFFIARVHAILFHQNMLRSQFQIGIPFFLSFFCAPSNCKLPMCRCKITYEYDSFDLFHLFFILFQRKKCFTSINYNSTKNINIISLDRIFLLEFKCTTSQLLCINFSKLYTFD
jgi:hypothetical protein